MRMVAYHDWSDFRIFLHHKYDWKFYDKDWKFSFILQFFLLTCNLSSCMLTCFTVYKLLSLFLELNVCSLRIYISEFVQREVYVLCGYAATLSIPRSSQPAGHSGTVDVLLFTQFDIYRILHVSEFWIRRSSADLGAPSVFGFPKYMPTKMTL